MTPDAAPAVLVLLATYNGRSFLDAQLASLLWQVGVRVRVLARDDGSTDGTLELLEQWRQRFPDRIAVLPSAVRTGTAAGGFLQLLDGASLDEAEFVALADQDDVWLPDKLARAVGAMTGAGADGYSSALLAYDEAARAAWVIDKSGGDADLDYLFQGASAGCTYVLSSRAAHLVRDILAAQTVPLVRGISHDWTFYAICRSRGLGWVQDPRPGLLYRQHAANQYGAQPGMGGIVSRLRRVRNSWYREHVGWLRHVVAVTPAEQAVFDAVDRGDRLWLARNARRFRRSPRDAALLRVAVLTGMF